MGLRLRFYNAVCMAEMLPELTSSEFESKLLQRVESYNQHPNFATWRSFQRLRRYDSRASNSREDRFLFVFEPRLKVAFILPGQASYFLPREAC